MRKVILRATFVAIVGAFVATTYLKTTQGTTSDLLMANVEALTQKEGGESEKTKCPDFNYVPDRYIKATGQPTSVTTTCSVDGELSVGNGIVTGSYKKGQSYSITYQTFNCDGEATGACCDQRRVGTFRV